MMAPVGADEQQVFDYDVQLTRRPPDSLRARYPHMTVRTTRAQTALRRRVEGPEELDALISEIGTVGLTLTDVHLVQPSAEQSEPDGTHRTARNACEGATAGPATYEVRVVGELGQPLLRHLGCAHYRVPELTLVRLALVASELSRFLQACTDGGAKLERVRRLGSRSPARCG